MIFKNFILFLFLSSIICEFGYCESRDARVYPQFAGVNWESSKEGVIESLRKRNYKQTDYIEGKDETLIFSKGKLIGYPVVVTTYYDTSKEKLGLKRIQVGFEIKNLSGLERQAALSRVIDALMAKYGDVSGTIPDQKALYWTAAGFPVLFLTSFNESFLLTYVSPKQAAKRLKERNAKNKAKTRIF